MLNELKEKYFEITMDAMKMISRGDNSKQAMEAFEHAAHGCKMLGEVLVLLEQNDVPKETTEEEKLLDLSVSKIKEADLSMFSIDSLIALEKAGQNRSSLLKYFEEI